MTARSGLRVVSGAEPPRDPRTLCALDWCALALVAAALLAGSVWAGTFSTVPRVTMGPLVGGFSLDNVGVSIILSLAAAAFGLLAWRELRRKVAIGAVPGLAGSLLLFFLWSLVSIVRSPAPYMSLNALAALAAVLLAGGVAARVARDRAGLGALVLVVVAAGSIPALMGISDYAAYAKQGISYHREFATFVNPDFLAGFLIIVLPTTFAAFAAAREPAIRLLLGLLLAVQSACLFLTGSRAGTAVWLLALAALLLLAAASDAARGLGRRIAVGLAIVVVASALASVPTLARVVHLPGRAHRPASTAAPSGAPVSGSPSTASPAPAADAALSGLRSANEAQAHSAIFRRYTWIGTVRMALANPIFGAGLGAFEVTYPRYAITAYTSHAHNGYLQVLGETGIPGLLFLLAGLAAASAFAAHVLLRGPRDESTAETSESHGPELVVDATLEHIPGRTAHQARGKSSGKVVSASAGKKTVAPQRERATGRHADTAVSPRTEESLASYVAFDRPRLLLVGLIASVLAALAHNLIDSDWYMVESAAVLAVVVALMVAYARDISPLATQRPRPLSRAMIAAGLLVAIFVLWRAGATAAARIDEDAAGEALATGQLEAGVSAANAAISADPLDPEPRLDLGSAYQAMHRQTDAEETLNSAVRVAPTGKAYYRLGQCYARSGDIPKALDAFERSRREEPHNTQNLRVLAETLRSAGQTARAVDTYREITALEDTPYGKVRAMPEMVETDFALAHAALADIAFKAGRWDETSAECSRAMDVLREYWTWFRRDIEVRQRISPEKRDKIADLTDRTLSQWQQALARLGRVEEANRVRLELDAFRARRPEYVKASERAGVGGDGAP